MVQAIMQRSASSAGGTMLSPPCWHLRGHMGIGKEPQLLMTVSCRARSPPPKQAKVPGEAKIDRMRDPGDVVHPSAYRAADATPRFDREA